ncbi:MAG: DUF58 domain-containing protein [Akkermansiaceae bacterium]|nr:DUF58 domain-containing protein [Akkermansiaceae bacterium]
MAESSTAAIASGSPDKEERFHRWLHRSYRQTSGMRYFLLRRIRPAGYALGAVLMVSVCLGVGHERSSVYQVLSLAMAMGAIGMIWVLLRRARLEASRELPRHGTAGEVLSYTVMVRNVGAHSIARAWLIEGEPDPRPPFDEFHLIREPGEEERNWFDRTFIFFRWQWLMLRRRLFEQRLSLQELRLKPGESGRVHLQITPLRRGIIQLRDLRVMLPDPFSLLQKCTKVSAPAASLMVLPRRYPLPNIELPGGVPYQMSGEATSNSLGNAGEFVGLRDYRPEDPMRHIHWKSWARLGRPIVKELEDTHYPRYGLVLDCLSTDRSDVGFEEAVSVAASFASSIDTSKSLLDLMFVKNEAHRITVGRGVERTEKLLEVLAGVTPERSGGHEELARLVLKYKDDMTSCIVVLNGWSDSRAELLHMLQQGGVIAVPVIVGMGKKPAGAPGYWLRSGEVAEDLGKLPTRLQ